MITESAISVAKQPGNQYSVKGSPVVLMMLNQTRRGAWITALSSNSKRLRYSLGPAASTSSAPLEAGNSIAIDSSYFGPITAVSDDGSEQFAYVVEW